MNKGTLYLLPTPLSEEDMHQVLTDYEFRLVSELDCFVVEELRTARRFLSAAGRKGQIDSLSLYELNEHSTREDVEKLSALFDGGRNVGLLSEAGLPAVADPGAALVELCHKKGIRVVPLAGPSSLMMALMSSGLNGQRFTFNGYLPAKTPDRRKALSELERKSERGASQIFIETPYRNDSMLDDILECCKEDTRLCIAANISAGDEFIKTKTVSEWKKEKPEIGKRPCVFILSSWKGCSLSDTTDASKKKRN